MCFLVLIAVVFRVVIDLKDHWQHDLIFELLWEPKDVKERSKSLLHLLSYKMNELQGLAVHSFCRTKAVEGIWTSPSHLLVPIIIQKLDRVASDPSDRSPLEKLQQSTQGNTSRKMHLSKSFTTQS